MSAVGHCKIVTQQRVIGFLRDVLGYAYFGHLKEREGSSHIEEDRLTGWLRQQGHNNRLINRELPPEANNAAAIDASRTLFGHARESVRG